MSRRCLAAILVAGVLGTPATALATERERARVVSDRVSIRLARPAAREALGRAAHGAPVSALGLPALDRVAAALGARLEPEFRGEVPPPEGSADPDFTAYYLVHLAARGAIEPALAALRALPEVAAASAIPLAPVVAVPDDSLWSGAYWFYQPSRRDIHAPEVWDLTRGDSAVVVAILDTGVVPYHPDLGGTAGGYGQMWANWRERDGEPGVDDDGNGYPDDLAGWDFVDLPFVEGPMPGEDYLDEDGDPNDYVGHGTAVAGLVGALSDNRIGITGTAWNLRLLPLRVGWSTSSVQTGVISMSYLAQAVRYATRMKVDVINLSVSTLPLLELDEAVGAAIQAGITVVNAAGNNGSPHYVADREDVIAVTATDRNDGVPTWANRGWFVDLAAPGADLATTILTRIGTDSLGSRQSGYNRSVNGTSFSAAIASGTVALLQAHRRTLGLRPLRPDHVQLLLKGGADEISAQNPGLFGYGTGRLNAYRAALESERLRWTPVGGRSTGPAAVLPTSGPAPWIAFATTDGKLVILDAATLDTVRVETLPSPAVGGVAAADLGGGLGLGMFVCLSDGTLAGFHGTGVPMAGWPMARDPRRQAIHAALGDLDGDGVLEVVCAGREGRVWAWTAGGALVSGFPVEISSSGIGSPPALADLDGAPGVEIVVAAGNGTVHAVGAKGAELAGWPTLALEDVLPAGPVVLATQGGPVVVVAGHQKVRGFARDGVARFRVTRAHSLPPFDPAVGDLDLDGMDEIVVGDAMGVTVYSPDGTAVVPNPWAVVNAIGAPVIGQLDGTATPEIVVPTLLGPGALTASGEWQALSPIQGGSAYPSVGEFGGRDTEVLAGAGHDGGFYLYRPRASPRGGPLPWPTPRGNVARTGSRLYAPQAVEVGPEPVADLRVVAVGPSSLVLNWTASGDDGRRGRADHYVLRVSDRPPEERPIAEAPEPRILPGTVEAGGAERFVVGGLERAKRYWLALQPVDHAGQTAPYCAPISARTSPGPLLAGRSGAALVAGRTPSPAPVPLLWQAAAEGPAPPLMLRIHDLAGRVHREIAIQGESPGMVHWDGRDAHGRSMPAGLYFARLAGPGIEATARIVLLPR